MRRDCKDCRYCSDHDRNRWRNFIWCHFHRTVVGSDRARLSCALWRRAL